MNTKKIKQKLLWGIPLCIALIIGGYFMITRGHIVDVIQKKSAQLFVYEYIPNQKLDIKQCLVTTGKDSLYSDFRQKYRFHFQTLAMGTFADSSRLLLISEPPPYFELDSIKSIFAKFTHSVETRYHKMGYDGRVTDILISVANATEENMHNLIAKLYKEIYLSDYKSFALELSVKDPRVYFAKENLDYQISLDEFDQWFMKDNEQFFRQQDTNTIMDIPTIFKEKKSGVFFSKIPGFVAWAIPKKSDLQEYVADIRQFSLDADLILGALSDSSTLVIIGREREEPLYSLPPLNVETVLLLASVTEKELSQSLDINDLMAGKMSSGRDWCPTYLSKELENTEFGHLMTITDILLKDWSENGTIQEGNYRYPEPGRYPFKRPLFKMLGLNELVYNWNTQDAMYAIDLENVTIYTLNHTGSLPVSYFNSQERSVSVGSRYESQAYHYFSHLNNTDLVRVVQYTALYQLFIDNEIHYAGETYNAYPKNKAFLLYKPTMQLLNIFKNLQDKEIERISDSLSKIKFVEYQNKKVEEEMQRNETTYQFTYSTMDRDRIYNEVHHNTQREIAGDFYNVKRMLQTLSEEKFQRLAKYLSYPRGFSLRTQEDYRLYMNAQQTQKLIRNIGKNYLSLLGMDLNEVKNFYVGSLANSGAKYLKTPSIIVTFNDLLTTGGHNLSSRISRVKSTTNYKKSYYAPTMEVQPSVETGGKNTQPAPNAPVANNNQPAKPATQPTSGQAPAAKPTATKPPVKPASTTPAAKSTSTQSASSGTGTATRSRSAVIATTQREHRGF
ncbi:MAG: hypothetical protein LBV46_02370 [Bacteroidales bacterium]|jgi:hypothetical protein|nr:hypothetical protein [Bacteroidales bacterium]